MKKGFTLIEVLTVVLLIGILTGFAVSSYQGARAQAKLQNAVILVEEAFNQARNLALTGAAESYSLELVSENNNLSILKDAAALQNIALADEFLISNLTIPGETPPTINGLLLTFAVPKADLNIYYKEASPPNKETSVACFTVTNGAGLSQSFTATASTVQLTSGNQCSSS